jgi:hypothetical protein
MADLTPGRELDERVARLVYGDNPDQLRMWERLIWSSDEPPRVLERYFNGPSFSTDPAAALLLMKELAGRGWGWSLAQDQGRPCCCRVTVPSTSDYVTDYHSAMRYGPTLPLAVCAAILAALDKDGEA